MSYMTRAEMLSETRKIAAGLGLTFKEDGSRRFYNGKAYMLTNRKTGEVIMRNMTLDMGHENALNGYFAHVKAQEEGLEKLCATNRHSPTDESRKINPVITNYRC